LSPNFSVFLLSVLYFFLVNIYRRKHKQVN